MPAGRSGRAVRRGRRTGARSASAPVYWRDRAVHLSAIGARHAAHGRHVSHRGGAGPGARRVRRRPRIAWSGTSVPSTRRGWLERHTLPGRRGGRAVTVVVLSREGHAFARRHLAPDDQTLHWGLVKPKEQAHDAALYRVYQAEAHAHHARRRHRPPRDPRRRVEGSASRRRAIVPHRGDAVTNAAEIARALHPFGSWGAPCRFRTCVWNTRPARAPRRASISNWRPNTTSRRRWPRRRQAGFTIYAPASQTGRLSAALEDRGLIAEILSL